LSRTYQQRIRPSIAAHEIVISAWYRSDRGRLGTPIASIPRPGSRGTRREGWWVGLGVAIGGSW
jgi:hypothetical protein